MTPDHDGIACLKCGTPDIIHHYDCTPPTPDPTCYAVTGLTNDPDPRRIDSIHPTEAEAEAEAEAARLIRERIVARHVVIYQLPDQETP